MQYDLMQYDIFNCSWLVIGTFGNQTERAPIAFFAFFGPCTDDSLQMMTYGRWGTVM